MNVFGHKHKGPQVKIVFGHCVRDSFFDKTAYRSISQQWHSLIATECESVSMAGSIMYHTPLSKDVFAYLHACLLNWGTHKLRLKVPHVISFHIFSEWMEQLYQAAPESATYFIKTHELYQHLFAQAHPKFQALYQHEHVIIFGVAPSSENLKATGWVAPSSKALKATGWVAPSSEACGC